MWDNVDMDIRRHRGLAAWTVPLFVLLAVVWLTVSDNRSTSIIVDVVVLGTLAVMFLIPFSWLMRVAVPHSLRLRVVTSVIVLILLTLMAAYISLWWVTSQHGGRMFPE
jgi:hypothetical protein